MCDGSDSDYCWLMECGYITCIGECVHGECNGPQHKHHKSQHQTLRSLWGAQTRRNQASWLIVYYHETPHPFFAVLSILRPRVKGRSFCHGGAVIMREALSRHLCFLHLLAGFAVRLTTMATPSSPSCSVWWNCDTDSGNFT